MRKLLLLLLVVLFCGGAHLVCAQNWGKVTVYASWEISTDFGTGGKTAVAYLAIADANQQWDPYPPSTPDNASNMLALEVGEKNYMQVANHVRVGLNSPTSFETDWLLQFSTNTGAPAKVTIRCLSNQLPNPETLKLQLLTVGGAVVDITAVTEGAVQEVESVPSEAAPNTLMATYEAEEPVMSGVQFALALAPGWNLVGNPFESVTDAGTLFDYSVMKAGANSCWIMVSDIAELSSGESFWVYNRFGVAKEVILTGNAYVGRHEGTALPSLSGGWNYVSPIGDYDKVAGNFKPSTEIPGTQFQWNPIGEIFESFRQSPELGRGYMVRE